MRLCMTDDLFFYEEQIKEWRRDYPGGITITDTCTEESLGSAEPANLLGPCLTVIRLEKFPTAKKSEEMIRLVSDHLDEEHVVIFFTKATRADLKSALAKVFPADSVVKMFAFGLDQRESYLSKHLPDIPLMKRVEMARRAEEMDMRSFRSRVMRLKELRATDDASIDREFPPLIRGESFNLVPLVEKGNDEALAKALLSANRVVSGGDEPMMVLGTLHWAYRIAYKMAIAPNREKSATEIGVSGGQASRIPRLTPERALKRHEAVADASEQIRSGRDGFETLSALLCRLSEMAKAERSGA